MKGSFALFCCCYFTGRKMQDIPDAGSFSNPRKEGNLLKLTGRNWLYAGSWKKRYCVLDGTKFYYYENEKSSGADKTSGVLCLDYYDVCEAIDAKEKKCPHVFIIDTSVRGFFNNRHQFAAETDAEMQDWIRSVHDVINDARNIRSRAGRNRIGSDKVSPISGTRIHVTSQMSDDANEHDVKDAIITGQLVNATKDRVRGPQGRRLPQRKSMMPTVTKSEDGLVKQRSFSLSNPTEEDDSPNGSIRISLSMETMDRGENSDEVLDAQRSSSSHEIPLQRADNHQQEIILPKKPLFGKLGGQHAALTKELEFKLKSGLAPGGRRFPVQEPEDEEASSKHTADASRLDKKLDNLQNKVGNMQRAVEGLEQRFGELKTENTQHRYSIQDQVQEMVNQAAIMLKEAEETNSKCSQALAEAQEAKEEHRRLLQECQETLSQLRDALKTAPRADLDDSL